MNESLPSRDDQQDEDVRVSSSDVLQQLLDEARQQSEHASALRIHAEMDNCLLDKIGQIVCMTANESHRNGALLSSVADSLSAILATYRSAHPAEALQVDRLVAIEAEARRCCPAHQPVDLICQYEPCQPYRGIRRGDGYSAKSSGAVRPARVSDEPHEPWSIEPHTLNESDEALPTVAQGPLVGPVIPVAATVHPLNFRNGPGQAPSGGQEPVTFRTFTETGVTTTVWPPDMSGAKGGDVVVMSGNLWLKLSTDSGKTFTDVDFTEVFAADTTYGGWAGDQVIHYVPQIDCFILYVQSKVGTKGGPNASKSVVKVAVASPADLKKFGGGKPAWRRQWNFTSDDFGMNAWLDFPDVSYGDDWLYLNTNTFSRTYDSSGKEQDAFAGRLFMELPLRNLQAGTGFSYWYGLLSDALTYGSPTQSIGDTNYWAAHVNNSTLRIYSSRGSDSTYQWRERSLGANWPMAPKGDIVSAAPDSGDWLSEDHRIIGATRVNNELWLAWTAAKGSGGAGGFNFPQAHIQIAKFDLTQDFKFLNLSQVWNADHAYAYPSLTTNSNNEVGISLSWGGGKFYGSHAVGILGDFVVWFGEASDRTSTALSPSRFGDYLHVRIAHPDTRFFSAFGYAVLNDPAASPPGSAEKADYFYVEFGREAVPAPGLH